METLFANLDPPITVSTTSRLGRMCVKSTVPRGHTGTLVYNSFRSNEIRLFNSLPPAIRNITETDVNIVVVVVVVVVVSSQITGLFLL